MGPRLRLYLQAVKSFLRPRLYRAIVSAQLFDARTEAFPRTVKYLLAYGRWYLYVWVYADDIKNLVRMADELTVRDLTKILGEAKAKVAIELRNGVPMTLGEFKRRTAPKS